MPSLDTKRIYISRDGIFYENIFPFATSSVTTFSSFDLYSLLFIDHLEHNSLQSTHDSSDIGVTSTELSPAHNDSNIAIHQSVSPPSTHNHASPLYASLSNSTQEPIIEPRRSEREHKLPAHSQYLFYPQT